MKRIKGNNEYIEINQIKEIGLVHKVSDLEGNLENSVDTQLLTIEKSEYLQSKENEPVIKFLLGGGSIPEKILTPEIEGTIILISASNSQPSSSNYMTLLVKKEFNDAEKSLKLLKAIGFLSVSFN